MVRTLDKVVRSPRIAARRREVCAQRRRRRRRITIAVVLIAGMAYGAWALTRSSVFSLQQIDVVGARTVSEQSIIDASGLRMGQSALGIDLGAVATRVRSLPGIADARVVRQGSLAIRIEVVERIAAIEVRAGKAEWFLDQDGVQMEAAHRTSAVLPILELPSSTGITSVSPTDEENVLAIWDEMQPSLRALVSSFALTGDHTITFALGRTTVIFGTADQITEKLLAVRLVRARVAAEHRTLIRLDVRAPSHPAARIS
jgi:cell division protein FtsQ